MKIKLILHDFDQRRQLFKLLNIMRISFLFMLIGIIQVSASVYSQEKITIKDKSLTMREVFKEIENQSNFRFFYNDVLTNIDKRVDLKADQVSITDLLNNLLNGTNLSYKILDNDLIIISPVVLLQQIKVTGVVKDAITGEAIPGVNIIVEGTTRGVTSDINGKYSIELSDPNSTLVFSYVGYISESVKVAGRSQIDLTLVADVKKLEEVVVVGYGTAKRSNLTTAQTTVSAVEMEKTVNTTVEQAIQGRTAGVYITQNSGQPGGGISVNIRGVNSINGSNEPLYVIDGVQIQPSAVSYGSTSSSNPLAGINPADIEDMQILQGPSATAVYGSRATNGVILITTKRGKAGDAKINYSYQYSLQAPPKHLDVMDLREYAQLVKDVRGADTPREFMDPSILGEGTDWQSELFNEAGMYKHQINVSGGNDKTTYYLSGDYLNQDGIAAGSGFERYSFRLNLDNKPREWAKLGASISFSQTQEQLTSSNENLISSALQLTPQTPVRNADGSWGSGDKNDESTKYAPVNPIAIANLLTNDNIRKQFLGSMYLDIKFLKDFTFRNAFNSNLGFGNSTYFVPAYSIGWAINAEASLNENTSQNTYWNWNTLLEYNKTLGKHTFGVMASHEVQESIWKNVGAGRTDFETNGVIDLNAGDLSKSSTSGGQGEWAMESYFGRLNYSFADRYIANGTIRRDGSSNFGSNNKWGIFPALSLAWRISKEPFFNVSFINELKLRFETGVTGNQGGGGIYATMANAPSEWGSGFLPSRYSNSDLKWEETKTNDIGLNVGLFANRIQLEFDYYDKNTDNLLMDAPLPMYMGSSGVGSINSPSVNIGSLNNKGWGFTFISTNINSKNFRWETNFNISGFKTKITKFYSDAAMVNRTIYWYNNWTQRSSVGSAPWQFLGYIQEGLFQSVDEINNSAVPADSKGNRLTVDEQSGLWVGDIKYKDISGPNGTPDGIIDTYDQTYIGNPWPKFFGGFTNTFTYKNLELSVLFTFSQGNDVYNYVAMNNSNPHNIYIGRNLLSQAKDFARTTTVDGVAGLENPDTNIPRLVEATNGNWKRFTSRWVEDGSFIRLKNVSLAYNLPSSLISKQKLIKDGRIILSAQNLVTISNYSGYDPEVGAYVGSNVTAGSQPIGLDTGRYPLTPVYTFNLILNF